jgi:hypothetical protein
VAARGVSIDREQDGSWERGDRYVADGANQHDLDRLSVVPNLVAYDERLDYGAGWRRVVSVSWQPRCRDYFARHL